MYLPVDDFDFTTDQFLPVRIYWYLFYIFPAHHNYYLLTVFLLKLSFENFFFFVELSKKVIIQNNNCNLVLELSRVT